MCAKHRYGHPSCLSLVCLSDNFGQISLYQNYQLQWQYICKFEYINAKNIVHWINTHSYSNRNRICKGLFFVRGGLSRKSSKSSVLSIKKDGTVFSISLFPEVLFFLCVRNIWNRIQMIQTTFNWNKKLTQITKKFEENQPCFSNKFWIFWLITLNLHHWPHILFHISKMQEIFR